jgi:hypothetical protein
MLGQYEESLRHYRRALLLPDWHDPRERARVLVEAATAASYAGPENSQETRTYLRVAIQQNSPLLRPIAAAALVLSLLRDGRLQEAQRVAAGSGLSSSFQLRYAFRDSTDGATWDRIVPILPPGEATAMAVALAIAMGSDDQSNHLLDYEQEVTGLSLPSHIAKGMVALGLPGAD